MPVARKTAARFPELASTIIAPRSTLLLHNDDEILNMAGTGRVKSHETRPAVT
jgi:hypothetical protein